jgi:hypothetical protein
MGSAYGQKIVATQTNCTARARSAAGGLYESTTAASIHDRGRGRMLLHKTHTYCRTASWQRRDSRAVASAWCVRRGISDNRILMADPTSKQREDLVCKNVNCTDCALQRSGSLELPLDICPK